MNCTATLRQSGGSIVLTIPRTIAQTLAVEVGSVVELAVEGHSLMVTPARRSLADRLQVSPASSDAWRRDDASLCEPAVGRELL